MNYIIKNTDLKFIHNNIKEIEEILNISNKLEIFDFDSYSSSTLKNKIHFNNDLKKQLEKEKNKFNKKDIINELTYLENYIKQNNYDYIALFINIMNSFLVILSILTNFSPYNNNDNYKIIIIAALLFLLIILAAYCIHSTYEKYLLIYLEYINRLRNNIINLYEEEQKENNHIIKETKNIQNIYNINLSGQYKDEDIEALKNIAKEDNQTIKIYIWNK